MAVEDINAAGGVLEQTAAVRRANATAERGPDEILATLLDEGADAIVGPVTSTAVRELVPSLDDASMVACSPSAIATDLGPEEGTDPVVYRSALPNDQLISFANGTIVARRDAAAPPGPWRVTIVARTDEFGTTVGAGLSGALTAQGFEVDLVGYDPNRGVTADQIAAVAGAAPDLVVLVSLDETGRVVRQLADGGVPVTTMLGVEGAMTPRLPIRTYPNDDGSIAGLAAIGTTGTGAFIERLLDGEDRPIVSGPQAYDCAVAIALAVAAAGSADPQRYRTELAAVTSGGVTCTTYQDCLDQLAAGEDIDYDGASGRVAFGPDGGATAGRFTRITFRDDGVTVDDSVDVDLTRVAEDAAQQAAIASAVFTAGLQSALTVLGFYSGPIDGVYDEAVRQAVIALQVDLGLPPTGDYDEATDQALRQELAEREATVTESTRQLQVALTELGFYTGPIDGVYSAEVVAAVKALQRQLGVPETGVLDAATTQAAFNQGLVVGAATATTVAPPTTEATTTTDDG